MAISRPEPRRRLKLPRNLQGGRGLQPYSRADAPYFRSSGFYVRVGGLAIVVLAGLSLLLLRAWSIQVLNGKKYAKTAQHQALRKVDLLGARGIDVISAPLPYGRGPSSCLHLMSLISLLDEQTALVDLPWLAVETVELLRSRGYRLIEIEYSERDSLACNVLSLGDKRLLALREKNEKTNQKLQDVGFNVRTFPGSELCINGGGGPTCLTRPLKRGVNLGGPTRVLV